MRDHQIGYPFRVCHWSDGMHEMGVGDENLSFQSAGNSIEGTMNDL